MKIPDFPNKMFGACAACGEQISEVITEHGRMHVRYMPNYREHVVELSNDTLMRVSVCDVDKVDLVSGKAKKTADKIMENHVLFWSKEKHRPDGYDKLKVVNPNTTARDYLRKREKRLNEVRLNKQINDQKL